MAEENEQTVEMLLTDQDRARMEDFSRQHSTEMLVILFTDMVGSTALKAQLGDMAAKALDDEHRHLLMQTVSEFSKAQAVKVMGDAWIFVFLKPGDAIRFALRAQALHRQARVSGWQQMAEFRVGIHLGTVVVEEGLHGPMAPGGVGDIKGLQADLTARIMGLAAGGQILCSRAVFDDARQSLKGADIEGVGSLAWRSHGLYLLKGRDEPLEICEVVEEPLAARFGKPVGSEKAKPVETSDEAPGWRPGLEAVLPGTNWELEGRLGEGGFGEVWLARDRSLPARKTVFKFCTKKSKVRSLRRELDVFNRLSAPAGQTPPGIIDVLGAHDSEPPYYIQLAYASGGDLRQWIATSGVAAPLRVRLDLALQMARALDIVHKAGFVHRDVKPSNFLVEPADDPNRAPTLKLSDFGIGQEALSAALGAGAGTRGDAMLGGGAFYSLRSQTLAQAAGSYFFIAPELMRRVASTPGRVALRADTAADIYSLGVSLYQLFSGDPEAVPGPGLRAVKDPILREDITACLGEEPASRPTAAALIEQLERYEARRDAAQAAERARNRLEKRRARRIIVAITGLLALAVGLGVLSLALFFRARAHYANEQHARKSAEREMYFAQILLAQNQIGKREFDMARKTLWGCPESLRSVEWGYLLKQCSLDFFSLQRPNQTISAVRWSPDGRTLATGTWDGALCFWDGRNGELLGSCATTGSIMRVRFSPDGRRLITTGCDGPAVVWDAATTKPLYALGPPDDSAVFGAFSANGERAAVISESGMLRVWDEPMRRLLAEASMRPPTTASAVNDSRRTGSRLLPEMTAGHALAFHPTNPERLAACYVRFPAKVGDYESAELQAAVWDVTEGRKLFVLEGHTRLVRSIQWSPDGARLLTACDDGVVRIYGAADGRQLFSLPHGDGGLHTLAAFSPNGTKIAVAFGHQIRLWDALRGSDPIDVRGHGTGMSVDDIEFFKDGKCLATAGSDGTIRVWAADTGQLLFNLQGHSGPVQSLQIHPKKNSMIASVSQEGIARVWNLAELDCAIVPSKLAQPLADIALSPDGQRMAAALQNGTAMVWDFGTRKVLSVINSHTQPLILCGFSPDGARLMTSARDGTLRVWDAVKGSPLTQSKALAAPAITASWSADGTKIATGHEDEWVRVWNAATGQELRAIPTRKIRSAVAAKLPAQGLAPLPDELTTNPVVSISFSPDGRRILLALASSRAAIWNLESNSAQCLFEDFPYDGGILSRTDFSPDGDKVLIVGGTNVGGIGVFSIFIRDANTGKHLQCLKDPSDWVLRARFSSDGARIISETANGVLRIWDVQTGRQCISVDAAVANPGGGRRLPGSPKLGNAGDYTPNRTALTVRNVYSRAVILLLAPWRAEDLPGDAGKGWPARFNLWRHAQVEAQLNAAAGD